MGGHYNRCMVGREPIPLQPTPLLGRDAELATAREMLGRPAVRLLTLTAPGGAHRRGGLGGRV